MDSKAELQHLYKWMCEHRCYPPEVSEPDGRFRKYWRPGSLNRVLSEIAKDSGDTHPAMKLEELTEAAETLGFETVLDDRTGKDGSERFVMMARGDGLTFTIHSNHDSDDPTPYAWLRFTWVSHGPQDRWPRYERYATPCGGIPDDLEDGRFIMQGRWEVKEGLAMMLEELENGGTLLPLWPSRPPFLVDGLTCRHDDERRLPEIWRDRVSRLPEWVREMTAPDFERSEEDALASAEAGVQAKAGF